MKQEERSGIDRRPDSAIVSGSQFAGLGIQFVVAILLCLYAGRWVDSKLGTAPLFLVAGVFVGAGASMYNMYRALRTPPKP